ncbi:uncharacterized protein LOC116121405 isoform X2 [Pistacia vera]|uniref:uncharacterized protein LOC116121405 isoform X1 n=1 Tax=Pistacia vera TaxID=55513 RepID=UPI001263CDA4|nr:uncharacterized protein LOC116121405 isoform X1 [Pistacia vera]XP_031263223.1 uncharacterized protein LOC116121405 isoform X2 [Pistacia vera]
MGDRNRDIRIAGGTQRDNQSHHPKHQVAHKDIDDKKNVVQHVTKNKMGQDNYITQKVGFDYEVDKVKQNVADNVIGDKNTYMQRVKAEGNREGEQIPAGESSDRMVTE